MSAGTVKRGQVSMLIVTVFIYNTKLSARELPVFTTSFSFTRVCVAQRSLNEKLKPNRSRNWTRANKRECVWFLFQTYIGKPQEVVLTKRSFIFQEVRSQSVRECNPRSSDSVHHVILDAKAPTDPTSKSSGHMSPDHDIITSLPGTPESDLQPLKVKPATQRMSLPLLLTSTNPGQKVGVWVWFCLFLPCSWCAQLSWALR